MARHLAAICGFLLATLAVTAFGAPIEGRIWNHSCGHAVRTESNTGIVGGRHGVGKMIRAVKDQITVALGHYKDKKNIIDHYYDEVKQMKKESYFYDWLPKKQRAWYNDKICSLPKQTRVKKGFQALNSSLQIFSATFEELKKFRPDKNAEARNKIIGGIYEQLRQVLCEAEWNLMCLNETSPEGEWENFVSKTKHWDKSPDETGILVQDWGVISFLEEYLKEWKVIVNSLNKEKACITKKRKPKRQKTKGKNQAP